MEAVEEQGNDGPYLQMVTRYFERSHERDAVRMQLGGSHTQVPEYGHLEVRKWEVKTHLSKYDVVQGDLPPIIFLADSALFLGDV